MPLTIATIRTGGLAIGLAALLSCGPVGAQGLVAEKAFPVAGACYTRVYDAAHLAAHPQQVVRSIRLWGNARSLISERKYADRVDPELTLDMSVEFVDGTRATGDIGCVEEKGRVLRCGRLASCAGDFAIEQLGDGRLRLTNDDAQGKVPTSVSRAPGFSPDATCTDGSKGRFVPPDRENRVFLLSPAKMADCP